MRSAEYRKLTLTQMQQRRWRTTRAMGNHYGQLPVGIEVEIVGKRNGLDLRAVPCKACGIALYVRKCEPSGIEEIPAS